MAQGWRLWHGTRNLVLALYFVSASVSIVLSQAVGLCMATIWPALLQPWMAVTKQLFGILLTSATQLFSPTKVTVCGDPAIMASVCIDPATNTLKTNLGDRIVVMCNHQLYSDWVFLWWLAYTSRTHGAIVIMLKQSLRQLPLLGWGMQNYNFLFLSRNWSNDEPRLTCALTKLSQNRDQPVWLTLFPEGTTFSRSGVAKTREYANKIGVRAPDHLLLPRTRGLRHSVALLASSVEYLYDATFVYSGLKNGMYGEEEYSLTRIYLQGHHPRHVYMHLRRFRVCEIPYSDSDKFECWLRDRWYEKDAIITQYSAHQQPCAGDATWVATKIQLKSVLEIVRIYQIPVLLFIAVRLAWTLARG